MNPGKSGKSDQLTIHELNLLTDEVSDALINEGFRNKVNPDGTPIDSPLIKVGEILSEGDHHKEITTLGDLYYILSNDAVRITRVAAALLLLYHFDDEDDADVAVIKPCPGQGSLQDPHNMGVIVYYKYRRVSVNDAIRIQEFLEDNMPTRLSAHVAVHVDQRSPVGPIYITFVDHSASKLEMLQTLHKTNYPNWYLRF